ncbi:restriction endonuclease subunit S [Shewanella avicenniae]|uniref:Restriction endonuclease subunit S n=1 Tax=Shewanella avicenniae TaxID=2814294 RepID=A0ABX7QTE1_9GAMM|nr:restriction endonuclease subunit S [Shewanella avicenniae]QSX33951.1 restriction endonuclease subunit S [Shewanella avicenniae]
MVEVNLSKGWAFTTIGSVARVSSGVGFPIKYQGKSEGLYPVYKVGDVSKAVTTKNGNLAVAGHYVDEREVAELKGEVFPVGATLFAKIGEAVKLNRRAFVRKPGLADNNVMAVIPDKSDSNRFLYHFLRVIDLTETSRSTTVPSIRKGDIEEVELYLPPLAEQKVIADKLDTLLAQVESTKARLERISDILKHFRQSVLSAAVSGKLTEEWRKRNISQFPYPRLQLGKIIHEMRNGLSSKPNELGNGYPILRISSVRPLSLDQNDVRHLDVSETEKERYALRPRDLLFTRYNGSIEFVGVCAQVKSLDHDVLLYPDKLIRVRVNNEHVTSEYLELFSACQEARDYVQSLVKSTSGQKGISGADFKKMDVALPAIIEQIEIARRVEELFTFADSIEQKATAALGRVNNLTQSILAKAFRGELTADWRAANPDLISGENSAEALLAKIQTERSKLVQRKSRRA